MFLTTGPKVQNLQPYYFIYVVQIPTKKFSSEQFISVFSSILLHYYSLKIVILYYLGVFAAWGKSCLKAGSLVLAREKFQRCLDKTGHYESTSDQASLSDFDESHESLNRGRYISRTSNMSSVSDTKPVKNPPILNEIIYILESKTLPVDSDVIKDIEDQQLSNSTLTLNQSFGKSSQAGAAISILSKLKNLKNISNGNYCQSTERYKLKSYSSRPSIDYLFYDECIYYLTKYGTHSSLLDFYVKHGDISRALNYIVDNQLNTDPFIDVYMKCLKDGVINILQENMAKIDSTLEVWKVSTNSNKLHTPMTFDFLIVLFAIFTGHLEP